MMMFFEIQRSNGAIVDFQYDEGWGWGYFRAEDCQNTKYTLLKKFVGNVCVCVSEAT